MKHLAFNEALTKAQSWVGSHEIYAIGESLDKNGKKVILVFASDTTKVSKILPKDFHGHKVTYYQTGEIIPHDVKEEE